MASDIFFYPAAGAVGVTVEAIKERLDAAGVDSWIQQSEGGGAPWIMMDNGDAALKLTADGADITSAALECSADEMEILGKVRAAFEGLGWVMDEETL